MAATALCCWASAWLASGLFAATCFCKYKVNPMKRFIKTITSIALLASAANASFGATFTVNDEFLGQGTITGDFALMNPGAAYRWPYTGNHNEDPFVASGFFPNGDPWSVGLLQGFW